MVQPELTCKSCKKRTPLNQMKYSKDGSGLICEECLNKETSSLAISQKTTPASFSSKITTADQQKKKVEYHCTSCAFKWARALDFRGPRVCPNCGRTSVVYNLPNDADKLLRELDQMSDI